tara:strand:- start:15111 stop:15431 length:321 start_codon:yes stop_codon:yes gene_type:complete
MSQFYGLMKDYNAKNSTVTRTGHKTYGMTQEIWSWQGSIRTRVWTTKNNVNMFKVELIKHPQTGQGIEIELARGTLDGKNVKLHSLEEFNLLTGEETTWKLSEFVQ